MVESIKINKGDIPDYDQDNRIDKEEWDAYLATHNLDPTKEYEIEGVGKGPLKELIALLEKNEFNAAAQSGDAKVPDTPDAKAASAELNKLLPQMEALKKQIEEAKKNQSMKAEDLAAKQQQLQQMITQAQTAMQKSNRTNINLSPFVDAAGGEQQVMSGKAQVAINQPGAQTPGGPAAQTVGGGQQPKSFYPPAGWGAQTLGGGSGFTTDTYMKSMAMGDNMMSSWDSINKNTNRGKQLMMLFFYFARMAESGDMSAMYQFMKFITYIVSKDKAKQQIEMGKKLIALQELSRQWTNKLLNVSTNSTDPNASNELMKTMTIVKSETDAIATSQKLISQMMEEFAQVVETLTNTTKSALETAGRIMRTVSTMR